MTDPYWVRYNRERQEREDQIAAERNPPREPIFNPESNVRPMLDWSRDISWLKYPHEPWERERVETHGDDNSPADRGYEITSIVETASLRDNAKTWTMTVNDDAPIEDGGEHEYWFHIILSHDRRVDGTDQPEEDFGPQGGYGNFEEAKRQAELQLIALLR